MIDPGKTAAEVADIAERTWFTRYPLPQRIVLDRGTEFIAKFGQMVRNDYWLKMKPITTRNPQANANATNWNCLFWNLASFSSMVCTVAQVWMKTWVEMTKNYSNLVEIKPWGHAKRRPTHRTTNTRIIQKCLQPTLLQPHDHEGLHLERRLGSTVRSMGGVRG
jgi:hypothetical protein